MVVATIIRQLNPPAPYVPEWFTKELTDLGGKTDNGKDPQLRLVWGGSATQFWEGRERIKYPKNTKKVAIGWEVMDENGERQLLPLHDKPEQSMLSSEDKRVGRIVDDWLDIGLPVFIVEEWCPPEVACDGWAKRRYKYDTTTNAWIDKLGPEPRQGFYRKLFTLAEFKGEMMYYMEPNEQSLVYIKKMLWLQRQEPALYSKRERPPEQVVEGMLRKRYAEVDAWETKFEEDLADRMVDRVRRSLLSPTSFASVNNNKEIIIAHK